ncbi:GNAT family N-acetyltransferase [Sphingomonas qilianensis]|uniref:GNAT family N-acetyltransferase n=1 Tax=Sphingomonas qilianensis TaxID=1736690 RepID=A0ABU9XV45_9SPHN
MTQLTPTSSATPDAASAPSQDGDGSADLVARDGYRFHVRPATPADEQALADLFHHVDKDDLRFRFLSAAQNVAPDQLKALVTLDHTRTENFLAIEPETGRIIATAMLAADATLTSAEVAIAIRSEFKRRGISWTLLDHVARCAAAKGIKTLESVESRENHEAIQLERDMGWVGSACEGDASLIVLRTTLDPSRG